MTVGISFTPSSRGGERLYPGSDDGSMHRYPGMSVKRPWLLALVVALIATLAFALVLTNGDGDRRRVDTATEFLSLHIGGATMPYVEELLGRPTYRYLGETVWVYDAPYENIRKVAVTFNKGRVSSVSFRCSDRVVTDFRRSPSWRCLPPTP